MSGGRGRRYWDSDEYYEQDKRPGYSQSPPNQHGQGQYPQPQYGRGQLEQPVMKPIENTGAQEYGGGGGYQLSSNGTMEAYRQYQTDPSLTFGGYSTTTVTADAVTSSSTSKKKKKESKKKKKRKRSSSSSSSSSDSSSGGGGRKKKKRESDSSSNSFEDEGSKKNKENKQEGNVGAQLTEEQRQALITQEGGYRQKQEMLEREIVKLQVKEEELKRARGDPRLIEETKQLQVELKARYQAVKVVLEKISNVLLADTVTHRSSSAAPVAPPPPKLGEHVKASKKELADVDYEDNGQHWCRLCNVFPSSVEDMLKHVHSQEHKSQVEQLGIDDKPWHKRNSIVERTPSAMNRKLPFRGMQFFSPVEGWYCRLCNAWMGDEHCATIHLKSVEHNVNYMTFLDEHPDWETKWQTDREKARSRTLEVKAQVKKSRFESMSENDDNSRSIRVQMRNTVKVEDAQGEGVVQKKETNQDKGLDEWMKQKPPPVDIIDTQKFAEIVRQRHGNSKKEEEVKAETSGDSSRRSPRRRDEGRDLDRRRHERVEMQFRNERDRGDRDRYRGDRDRGREREGRGRRSRSRSRDRDRDKDRGAFQSRRRSRERDRDRRDRERDKDRVPPRSGEGVKKQMPMIGKMPLFKRAKDNRSESDKTTETQPDSDASNSATFPLEQVASLYDHDSSVVASYGDAYAQDLSAVAAMSNMEPMEHSAYEMPDPSSYVPVVASMVPPPADELKPPGEKEAPGGTNLDNDLQQALDIIYKAGGKPITVPPPNYPMPVPPPSTAPYDYSAYQNYVGYEPYQMSFEGYSSAEMEETSGTGTGSTTTISTVKEEDNKKPKPTPTELGRKADAEPEDDDDDMDDLAMLGIDVDDTAVVRK